MLQHTREIVILTGPPGSGKTTTARSLATLPGSTKVHLHADDFWHCIRHGALSPYRPAAHVQNGVVMGVLANAAAGYAGGDMLAIVDGIIGPWFLSPFRALPLPVHYIVLRPPLADAIQRCRQRGGDTLTDAATITALHGQFAALGALENHVLDIAGYDARRTLDAVIQAIAGGAFRLR